MTAYYDTAKHTELEDGGNLLEAIEASATRVFETDVGQQLLGQLFTLCRPLQNPFVLHADTVGAAAHSRVSELLMLLHSFSPKPLS